MKKKHILLILVLVIVALLLWWRTHRPATHVTQRPNVIDTNSSNAPSSPIQRKQTSDVPIVTNLSQPTPESNPAAWIEWRLKQMEEDRQKGLNEWRTPIAFYGKAVDENDNPVAGAQINFDCNDLSPSGTSFYHTQSDENGLFSITNIRGKLLGVKVSKDGYYSYLPYGSDFSYAGENQNFVPDAANPVVFRLKKKGVAEPLAHCKNNFHVERDGTPLTVDLMRCRKVAIGQGHVVIECWTNDQGKKSGEHYDWKCRVSVPGGGIIQTTNRFDFVAPVEGYQAFDEIDVPASMVSGWHSNEKRKYFGKTANGIFLRFTFEMIAAGDHFFEIESFLNPSGSRNLEFDPARVIRAGP